MSDISKIKLPNDFEYDIKDAKAVRQSDVSSAYSATGTAPVNGTAVKASMTGTLNSTDSNHSATSKAVADSQAEQNEEIAWNANNGVKNLLEFDLDSVKGLNTNGTWDGNVNTVEGVTITVNADKTISFVRTGSGDNVYFFLTSSLPRLLSSGSTYILSGVTGGSSSTFYLGNLNNWENMDGDTEKTYNGGFNSIYVVITSTMPLNTPITIKPMIRPVCIKDSTFQSFALSNPVITPALINQVDDGTKNKLHITQIGSSDANVGTKITSQGVEYEIQLDGTITAYRKTSSSSGAYIFLYENGSVKDVSEFFDGQHVWSGNPSQYPSTVSVWYKIGSGSNVTMPNGTILPNANGESVRVGFQISASASPTQSDPIVFKPMICSVSDWQVSRKFVPYCPTMQELYQMILALQQT